MVGEKNVIAVPHTVDCLQGKYLAVHKTVFTKFLFFIIIILFLSNLLTSNNTTGISLAGILNVIPMQLLAYHIAKNRGLTVDAQSNQERDHCSDQDSSLNSPDK